MNWSGKIALLCLAVFFGHVSSYAQIDGYYSPRDSVWIFYMDSVFVEESVPPQLSQISMSSVSEERINAMGYRDLNEIITGEVPGVFGTQKGIMGYGVAGGSAGKISIRGLGGEPTTDLLVAQNGKPEIMGLMGHPVPDAYSADFIEQVEVIRGPASVLYGTNAMGGVINMKTKRVTTQGFETRVRAASGNHNLRRLVLQNGGKVGDVDYYLVYGRRATDGHRPHSAFESDAYHAQFGYEPAQNIYLSLKGKSVPFYLEDPGPTGGSSGNEYDIVRSDITLSSRMSFGSAELDYQIFHNWGEHKISDGFHSSDYADGFTLKNNLYFIENNSTTIGLDYRQYGGEIFNVNLPPAFSNPSGETFAVSEVGGYILTEQQVTDKLLPSAGLRVQNHTEAGNLLVPHLGMEYRLSEIYTAYGSYSHGFRNPTIRELFLFPAPNPDLEPERTETLQAGFRYNRGQMVHMDLSYYHTTGKNIIEQTGTFPNFTYQNRDTFTYSGIEGSLKMIPFRGLHLRINYSRFFSEKPLANQPEDNLQLSATFLKRFFTLRYNAQYVGGAKNFVSGSYTNLDDYLISNIGIEIIPVDFGNLFLNVNNLFDADYQTMIGFPMPGRTFEGGLILDF
ncbi:MAG: TonB-dependent receptor [Candidatus Marinimicrobia bacterium]|nr:TonB-dependent receptor [Candidatus Neomarinimicrobiota bacterium]